MNNMETMELLMIGGSVFAIIVICNILFMTLFKNTSFAIGAGEQSLMTSGGKPYFWFYQPPRRNSRSKSVISISTSIAQSFALENETILKRLAKFLCFATEFQTRDSDFDKNIYVFSDSKAFCDRLHNDSELRSLFKQLFSMGVAQVHADAKKGRLSAKMSNAAIRIFDSPFPKLGSDTDNIVSNLHAVNERLSTLRQADTQNDSSRGFMASICASLCPAITFASIFIMVLLPYKLVSAQEFLIQSALCGLILAALALILINLLFGRSSHGYVVFKYFLFFGIIGSWCVCYATLYIANYAYDTSEATPHVQRVVGKHITQKQRKNRKTNSYYLEMTDWRENAPPFSIVTSKEKYEQTPVGSTATVHTHTGYLGYEWIEKYDLR